MESQLSLIIANFSGRPREATLNGRKFLVCNVVMIVPGVLPGSRGELLYPEDEVANSIPLWDGMPLTNKHPVINGEPTGARNPAVADKFWLGHVFNVNYDGRLTAEAWFDIELCNRLDKRIIPDLKAGKKIEISTGLFTKNELAVAGSTFNGKSYTHIARNYKPDHLAVLMDEVGACSVQDGCGLNVNHSNPQGDLSVNKEQLIAWLTTNCACWKGASAPAALNAMTEPELTQLKVTAEANTAASSQLKAITNALTTGFVVNGAKVTLVNGEFKAEQITPAVNANQPVELKLVGQQTDNRNETFLQLLDRTGSPQEKAVWNTAVNLFNQKKADLIVRLTENITDAVKKAELTTVYNGMDVVVLEKIAPPAQVNNANNPTPNYSLGAGGPLVNQNIGDANLTVNKVDGLPVTKIQFENPLVKASA